MTIEIKEFFAKNEEKQTYLTMKLLYNVFLRMNNSDDSSKLIIKNLEIFNLFDISLIDSDSMFNYVYTEDDLIKSEFAISKCASEMAVAHEFGHLLLDFFSEQKLPDNYIEINKKIIERLLLKKDKINNMLISFRDHLFKSLIDSIEEPIAFIERNYDILKQNPELTENDLINKTIVDYFFFFSNFDEKANNFNKVGNILDSIFHGNNPFYELYGNEEFSPLIACHSKEYYLEDENGCYFAGFEEQFADYLLLKLYNKEMAPTIQTLKSLLGDEWFIMMDEYYCNIALKVANKNKQYKLK